MTPKFRSTLARGIAMAITFLALAFSPERANALEKIPFTLNWKMQGTHAAIFLAADRGYFAAEGLELEIVAGDGSANVVNRLASGAYQIGMGDVASLVRFNTLNPDKRVKALYNQSPADLAIVALKNRNITKPADLRGKIVGAPIGDTAYKMFPAFSAATGVAASDIKWEHMAANIREAMLMQGKVDAITANESTAYFNLKGAGLKDADMVFIRYGDAGLNLMNIGLIANESFIKEKPETVRKIVRALNKGFVAALADPNAAIDALLKRDPLLKRDIEMARMKWGSDRMIEQPDVKAGGLGFYSDASAATTIDIVATAENLTSKIAVKDFIDLSFLPPASDRALPAQKTN